MIAQADIGDSVHRKSQRRSAIVVGTILVTLTFLASHWWAVRGPELKPFVPIVATVWLCADALTAFLLFAQFGVGGRVFLLVLAAAYELSAFLTLPYIAVFPGLFEFDRTVADAQLSAWLWASWHFTFPAIVALALLADRHFAHRVSPHRVRAGIVGVSLATFALAVGLTMVIGTLRDVLPPLVLDGRFQPAFKYAVLPVVIGANLAVCGALLARGRGLTSVQLWLTVAVFTAALDAIVQEPAPSRYSIAWDVGKLETVFTSTVVLAAILADIVGMYGRLSQLARAAFAATEAKSEFLATMSHELRTPMNGVVAMTEVLLGTTLDRRQHEYVMIVRESSQALLRLLDGILDYSKVEAGKLVLESVRFNLPTQVASIVALMSPQFNAKDVRLVTSVEPAAQMSVVGDPGRLRQVLLNLVGNALKFTPAGGSVEIRLTVVRPAARDGIVLRCAIVDTGIGIPPEALAAVFDPFSQADTSTARTHGGTGLGLSISRQLVELMGGTIGVDSQVGTGSTFWFELALSDAQSTVAQEVPEPLITRRRALHAVPRAKILIADDNEINMRVAVEQFRQLGFEILCAADGREALEVSQRDAVDLIFMDCRMPGMDGFAATRAIRELETGTSRHVPIVALTADCRADDRAACMRAGMDDYLAKPATLDAIRAVVDRWFPPRPRPEPDRHGVIGSL